MPNYRPRAGRGPAPVSYPDRLATQSGGLLRGRGRDEPATSGAATGHGASRQIAWEGFAKARDLGGLPTRDGRVTRFGAYIRSGDLRFVTESGWQMACEAGVRTVVDLRNDEIRPPDVAGSTQLAGPVLPPSCIDRVEFALDDVADTAFRQFLDRERLNGTPLYFRPFLDHKPARCAGAVTAVASARRGGVIFHCGAGRDRTGLVTLLLLALADVEPEAIAHDYELSAEWLKALFTLMGKPGQEPSIQAALAEQGTTVREAILGTLDGFDAETYLLAAGVSSVSLTAIRARLLG